MEYPVNDELYYSVNLGRMRKRVLATDSGAVSRINKENKEVWEKVLSAISGVLTSVSFRDGDYGEQWIVHITDEGKKYAIQIQADSEYGRSFLKKFPFMVKGSEYTFKPYDFASSGGKRTIGLGIEHTKTKEKIQSYYQNFSPKEGEEGKWNVTNLHGYPEFDGDPKDKSDLKIHFAKVEKFLREGAEKHLKSGFDIPGKNAPKETEEFLAPEEKDDLPF
jgi:hypothetical protein